MLQTGDEVKGARVLPVWAIALISSVSALVLLLFVTIAVVKVRRRGETVSVHHRSSYHSIAQARASVVGARASIAAGCRAGSAMGGLLIDPAKLGEAAMLGEAGGASSGQDLFHRCASGASVRSIGADSESASVMQRLASAEAGGEDGSADELPTLNLRQNSLPPLRVHGGHDDEPVAAHALPGRVLDATESSD